MVGKGIEPSLRMYHLLISKSDTFLEALSLQEEMLAKGIEPTSWTYNRLIHKSDTFLQALSLQKEMVGKGIEPSLRMYHLLISKSDTFLEALSLQEEMLAKGIKPTLGTSYSLIGKFQLCEGDEKWALLKCIIDDFSDNLFMYKIFITITGQWIKQKKLDVGLFLERYHQFVIQNDRTIYTFCSYLESAGHVEATLKLLEHVKEKNSEYFNVRANCQKHTDLAAALTLYDEAIALANQPKVIAKYWNNKALAIYQARRNDLLADAKAFAMRSQTLHAHGYGFNTLKQLESWESELSK
jgi:tetratricopeptide (TPR) repeat protein